MIDKLEPRQMIRVSLVAKKLHEVIDYIKELEDKIESKGRNKINGQGNRTTNQEKSEEKVKKNNQGRNQ